MEKSIWINIYNEKELRDNGIYRPELQQPRDKNVWTKTEYEKKCLRKAKRQYKDDGLHFVNDCKPYCPFNGDLIVSLSKNKIFNKSTFSYKCNWNDIPYILSKFLNKNGDSLVKKISFNGISRCVKEFIK